MMYLICKHDGSVKLTNLNEIITQGSTTTTIFVAVEGYNASENYNAIAQYILPNKTESAGIGIASIQEIGETSYDGWEFSLTQDETYYYGELLMSVKVYETGTSNILFTFPIYLTINKSGFVADTTNITITQYTNLVSYIESVEAQIGDFLEQYHESIETDYVVYGVDSEGNQTMVSVNDGVIAGAIPMWNSGGRLETGTPVLNNECANKSYVDGKFVIKNDDSSDSRYRFYAINEDGTQEIVESGYNDGCVPVYNGDNCIQTDTPYSDTDCANKKYVDDNATKLYKHTVVCSGTDKFVVDGVSYDELTLVFVCNNANKFESNLDSIATAQGQGFFQFSINGNGYKKLPSVKSCMIVRISSTGLYTSSIMALGSSGFFTITTLDTFTLEDTVLPL